MSNATAAVSGGVRVAPSSDSPVSEASPSASAGRRATEAHRGSQARESRNPQQGWSQPSGEDRAGQRRGAVRPHGGRISVRSAGPWPWHGETHAKRASSQPNVVSLETSGIFGHAPAPAEKASEKRRPAGHSGNSRDRSDMFRHSQPATSRKAADSRTRRIDDDVADQL